MGSAPMADDLTGELVARLKVLHPEYADIPDDVLAASIFHTTNARDAGGAPSVAEALSPWTKAATIGAPGLGERYSRPTYGEVVSSDNPARALLNVVGSYLVGAGRPRSVAAADPIGLEAWSQGKGPMPILIGSTTEVGPSVGAAAEMGRGLYSRVDDAAARLPVKGAHPNKVASLLKSTASAEELAYRQVPEFLAAQGNTPVTPEALQAHLAQHPAPMPTVKTLAKTPDSVTAWLERNNEGLPQTPDEWTHLSARLERTAQSWQRNGDQETAQRFFGFAEDAGRHAEGVSTTTGSTSGQPKYAQYQVPGGEEYRETLITLPGADEAGFQKLIAQRDAVNDAINAAKPLDRYGAPDRFAPVPPDLLDRYNALQARIDGLQGQQFHSPHFDEPNILVHTRSNVRTLPTGEPGRFIEEVQSDWHQAGKKKGYKPAPGSAGAQQLEAELGEATKAHSATIDALAAARDRVKYGTGSDEYAALESDLYHAKAAWRRMQHEAGAAGRPGTPAREAYLQAAGEVDRLSDAMQALQVRHAELYDAAHAANTAAYARVEAARKALAGGVPDAPFKDSWPDLGLKQQLLEAARDPQAQWIGFTRGETQAARYDLSKQIDRLHWSPSSSTPGEGYLEAMKDGSPVLQKTVKAEDLPDLIGKEAAEKLLATPAVKHGYAQKSLHTLEGVDLEVGGEGMAHFYDNLLPKRLQKIVKPFGGVVEQTSLGAGTGKAWIVRLTPAMKARLVKEGLPLLTPLLSVGGYLSQMDDR